MADRATLREMGSENDGHDFAERASTAGDGVDNACRLVVDTGGLRLSRWPRLAALVSGDHDHGRRPVDYFGRGFLAGINVIYGRQDVIAIAVTCLLVLACYANIVCLF